MRSRKQEDSDSLTEGSSGSEQTEEELEEIIEKIPETELRSFVKQLAGRDDEICNTLMTRYAVRIDENQMRRLKEGVDQIVWEHGGQERFYRLPKRVGILPVRWTTIWKTKWIH